jgi:hypothetical protein
MSKALTIAIGAAAVAISGCGHASAENSGPTVQRDFPVGGFEQIEVAGPYDVDVRTGAAPGVQASGPQKAIERLVVEVRGDRLLIHPREEHRLWHFGDWSHDKVRLSVTVPQLRAAEIAGSGDIRINEVRGASFAGQIAGSGDLTVDRLDVQSLKLGIAGSGGAKAGSGRARDARYEIAGSGDIDGKGVASETASVSIAGSGSVAAHATGTAKVEIMGSGDVEVSGGAKCSISKAGSGSVRCS